MIAILFESGLFVAALAAAVALIVVVFLRLTPLGRRLRQRANRRRIEQEVALSCPLHGPQREDELVLLPSGERFCPVCYKEALHG